MDDTNKINRFSKSQHPLAPSWTNPVGTTNSCRVFFSLQIISFMLLLPLCYALRALLPSVVPHCNRLMVPYSTLAPSTAKISFLLFLAQVDINSYPPLDSY